MFKAGSKKAYYVISLLLVMLLVFGCAQDPVPTETPVVSEEPQSQEETNGEITGFPEEYVDIAAVPAGPGLWYVLGERLMGLVRESDLPLEGGEVLPGGGVGNVITVHEGRAALGLTQGSSVIEAFEGKYPYEQVYDNFGMVLNLFPAVYQMVVLENSGINSFEDLQGKNINVLQIGSGSEVANKFMFDVHDMSYDDLSNVEHLWFDTAYDLARDGRLHGSLMIGPLPHPMTVDLAVARDIKLIPLEENIIQQIVDVNPAYVEYTIPAGAYQGVDEDVLSVASPTILIARLDASEALIYELTKLFFEEWEAKVSEVHPLLKLSKEDLATPVRGVAYHPGAERYLKEAGLMQ